MSTSQYFDSPADSTIVEQISCINLGVLSFDPLTSLCNMQALDIAIITQ